MAARAFFAVVLTLFFLIDIAHGLLQTAKGEVLQKQERGIFSFIEDRLEVKIGEYINSFTQYLAEFNDKHLGESEFGRFLHYNEIKPTLDLESARSRPAAAGRMKKMAMAMMPLVFHVGATSTWMILTTIMAAKGVLIGLVLLVFKIAVSSAKLASFFTQLKGKHSEDHHGWSWSPPHHEYHGHDRSLSNTEHHHVDHHAADHHSLDHHASDLHSSDHHASDHHSNEHHASDHHASNHQSSDWHSYSPEWTPNDIQTDYHTLPSYKDVDGDKQPEYAGPYLQAEERKKVVEKKKFK